MSASLLLLDQLRIVGEELQVLQVVLLGIVSFDCNSLNYVLGWYEALTANSK